MTFSFKQIFIVSCVLCAIGLFGPLFGAMISITLALFLSAKNYLARVVLGTVVLCTAAVPALVLSVCVYTIQSVIAMLIKALDDWGGTEKPVTFHSAATGDFSHLPEAEYTIVNTKGISRGK